jgi:hypothetical protein
MKISEVIGLIAVAYNKGVRSDDSRLPTQLIYTAALAMRQRLISQQIRKRQKVSDWNFMVLPCVEMIEVPSHTCSCLPKLGCDVFRTKYRLPKPLTDLNQHIISFVMSIENGMMIDEASREEFLYMEGNKYTSKKPKYIIEDGYMYIPKMSPGVIKIKFLPENPIDVLTFPSMCPCEDCDPCLDIIDIDFPIDGDMIDTLVEMVSASLIAKFAVAIEDQSNNSKDSLNEQSK